MSVIYNLDRDWEQASWKDSIELSCQLGDSQSQIGSLEARIARHV